jgi:hypothetical protein
LTIFDTFGKLQLMVKHNLTINLSKQKYMDTEKDSQIIESFLSTEGQNKLQRKLEQAIGVQDNSALELETCNFVLYGVRRGSEKPLEILVTLIENNDSLDHVDPRDSQDIKITYDPLANSGSRVTLPELNFNQGGNLWTFTYDEESIVEALNKIKEALER